MRNKDSRRVKARLAVRERKRLVSNVDVIIFKFNSSFSHIYVTCLLCAVSYIYGVNYLLQRLCSMSDYIVCVAVVCVAVSKELYKECSYNDLYLASNLLIYHIITRISNSAGCVDLIG